MNSAHEQLPYRDVEKAIGSLLHAGVILAAGVVALGGIVYLSRHGTEGPDYKEFRPLPEQFRTPLGILQAAREGSGRGLIQLGMLLLIATPVARVIFSIYAFARERDGMYVLVTLIVLSVLLYSLFGPHRM